MNDAAAPAFAFALALTASAVCGCSDVSRFSTASGESYCGTIVGAVVRSGFAPGVALRMSFDADHLADGPGVVSTSDGRFADAPLRPIPVLFHDPLSTLQFGTGRDKNLVYGLDPADPRGGPTLLAVVSLLHDGNVELRLLRGAPPMPDGGAIPATNGEVLFGVFPLHREEGRCGF